MNSSRMMLTSAILVLAGCATVETARPTPVAVQTNVVVKTETVYKTNVVNQTNFVTVTNEVTLTNHVAVVPPSAKTKPAEPSANTLSIALDGAMSGSMIGGDMLMELRLALKQKGYLVMDDGKAHANVAIAASVSSKANLDEWFVCEGHALAKIAVGSDGTTCFEKRFDVTGERKLGRVPAEKAVVKPLCNSISRWIEDVLKSKERK